MIIGFGGIIVTFGWNQRDVENRRRALFQQLALEWQQNMSISLDPKFHATKAEDLQQYVVYPGFRTELINEVLTSGLLLRSGDKDLNRQLRGTAEVLDDVNSRLTAFNATYQSRSAKDIALTRGKVSSGATMDSVRRMLHEVKQILVDQYGFDPSVDPFITAVHSSLWRRFLSWTGV